MTVATELCHTVFAYTGVETTFPAGFPAQSAAHIAVTYTNTANPPVATPLVNNVNVTISLDPTTQAVTVRAINGAMPTTAGTITIDRNTPALQATSFTNLASFTASVHEQLHDAAAMRSAEEKFKLAGAGVTVTQFANPTAFANFFASTLGNSPQLNQYNTGLSSFAPVTALFGALNRVIAAQSGQYGGNAILGAAIQDVLGTVTPSFPCGLVGYGSVTAAGAGNDVFGAFARADIAANGFAGNEFDTNNLFADSPATFPPNLSFTHGGSPGGGVFDNCYAIGLQIVNIGPFKAHSGLRIAASGAPYHAGVYLDPNAALDYGFFSDATAVNGPGFAALLRGTGSTTPLVMQTVGAQVAGNPILYHQNIHATPFITFQVNQNGNIISNASTSAMPPAANLWMASDASAALAMDSFGAGAFNILSMRAARGTGAAPANVAQNDLLAFVGAQPFVNGAYGSYSATMLFTYTDPSPATGKTGSNIKFQTTVNGATARTLALTIENSGGIRVGTAQDPGINSFACSGGFSTSGPTPVNGNSYTLLNTDTSLFVLGTASCVLTLTPASLITGRWLFISNFAAFTVVSAAANVIPVGGGAAGTAILAATVGKWAILNYDGTNWRIVANN